MSIASMTEVAFQSRKDVGDPAFLPNTYSQLAGAAAGKQEGDTPVNTALRTMVTYIPTEVLTLYLAVVAALQPTVPALSAGGAPAKSSSVVFWLFLIGTPMVTWLVYAAKAKNAGKAIPLGPTRWPLWEMAAGTIAFAAWALAMPGQPFPGYNAALSGVVVLVTSTILGLMAPLFVRQLPS